MLTPNLRTGHVIGQGGCTVQAIRQKTGAQIKVFDKVPHVDSSIVLVWGKEDPPLVTGPRYTDGDITKDIADIDASPASLATLQIWDLIVEDQEEGPFEASMVVGKSQVGCLMGKAGSIIHGMRTASGANMFVRRCEEVPDCAGYDDQMIWIKGNTKDIVKKALCNVMQRLRASPPPEGFIKKTIPKSMMPGAGYPQPYPGMPGYGMGPGMPPPGMPQMMGGPPPQMNPEFMGPPPGMDQRSLQRLTFRIVVPGWKVPHVIGKQGSTIKAMRDKTGANINVENQGKPQDGTPKKNDYVVLVTSPDTVQNMVAAAQHGISAVIEKLANIKFGSATGAEPQTSMADKTDIGMLLPRNQVGCLLGQGGSIMAGMRQLTHAQIALINTGQPGFPESAATDETFVHVSGTMQAVLAGMHEITMRLRENKASSVPMRGGRQLGGQRPMGPSNPQPMGYPANPAIAPRQLQAPQQVFVQQAPMMQQPQIQYVNQQGIPVQPQMVPMQQQAVLVQQPQMQQPQMQQQPQFIVQGQPGMVQQQPIQQIQQPQPTQVQQQTVQVQQQPGQQLSQAAIQQVPQQGGQGTYAMIQQQPNSYGNSASGVNEYQNSNYGVPQQPIEQEPVGQQPQSQQQPQGQQAVGIKTSQFCVPIEKAGNIIGREGSKVNQIRAVTGAQIKIHDAAPGGRERIIEFTGTDEQVHSAHLMAYSFMIEDQNVPQPASQVQQPSSQQQPAALSAPQQTQSMQSTQPAGANGHLYGYGNSGGNVQNGVPAQAPSPRQMPYPAQQYGQQTNGQSAQYGQQQPSSPAQGAYQPQYGQQSQSQNPQFRQQS
mmetsp:Transcript_5910/g.7293  ORF Transcript_5910/g.7293 Transcript_5910/m.7293 type:complete len:822 (+) Transcript_5910:135-2600(+)